VHLGAALTELRNLRTVHALKPDATGTAPAPSGSSATPANGAKP
jgi:uroporphyrin-3 C-methyltransferase